MMAFEEDSRPFVALRQGAENFRSNFDENIETCSKTLDSKLSSLICDPDSFGSPSRDAQRLAANVEFSKAKFDIFMSMKSLVEEMEQSWKAELTQLKNNFLENVEILLASTKLETGLNKKETKLPSNTKQSRDQFESRSSVTSSMHPFSLLNTAKKIPVLNALLPKDEELTDLVQVKNTSSTNFSNNIIRSSHFSSPSIKTGLNKPPQISNQDIVVVDISDQDDETSEEDNEAQAIVMPLKQSERQVKKSAVNTSFSAKEISVKPPLRKRAGETATDKPTKTTLQRKTVSKETFTQESEEESKDMSDEDNEAQTTVQVRQRGRAAKKPPSNKSVAEKEIPAKPLSRRASALKETVMEEHVASSPLRRNANKGRKSILKSEENELHTTPSRSTRKRTAVKEVIQIEDNEDDVESNENDNDVTSATPKTPKNVHFSVGLDIHEDLEIYSPEVKLTRSAPRRKTMVLSAPESFSDVNLTPITARSKSKRKTIGSSAMDASVGPSPKRFKRGSRASMIPDISEEPEESDLLESDDLPATEHYTPWLLLTDLDGKIPAQPGIYELKVYKAKKSAYIGSCENLRQKLTLHKLGQSSGHKHLDKFLERNKNDVQVRYEKMSTAAEAKNEEMHRIKAFVEQHKTTPAYN